MRVMKRFFLYATIGIGGLLAAAVLVFAGRLALARMQVEREWQTAPTEAPELQATTRLEIVPLYEAESAGDGWITGHGVAYLIRTDSATVLLDVGFSEDGAALPPLAQNLRALGVEWDEIDALVISHPHPDHVGGVAAWQNGTLYLGEAGPDLSAMPLFAPAPLTVDGADVTHSAGPTLVSADVATTGALSYPEVFPIYLFTPKGSEQGLVVKVAGEGLVLITGCGHPTMERLVARAEALYGRPVTGVVGGLHYLEASAEEVREHIEFLAERNPKLVALSPHDSGPEAMAAFQEAFPDAYQFIRVGESIQFP
jgi:7,8-dihydropterin-6-yl-methyl-4-(beta-D-ribofuranosyl)aminobenzene 5'-phosphate synthase